jgi:predicted urease superfamily metal-dependent hydrolase
MSDNMIRLTKYEPCRFVPSDKIKASDMYLKHYDIPVEAYEIAREMGVVQVLEFLMTHPATMKEREFFEYLKYKYERHRML